MDYLMEGAMIDIRIGDCRQLIHSLENESLDCVMTSPPYWGLRDYKTKPIIFDGAQDCEHEWTVSPQPSTKMGNGGSTQGQHSKTKQEYYVLPAPEKSDFCFKCGAWRGQLGLEPTPELYIKHMLDFFDDVKLKLKAEGNCFVNLGDTYATHTGKRSGQFGTDIKDGNNSIFTRNRPKLDIPEKCLCMVPQRFAWGMIERGWILRNEIIWYKPNHMPESVTDRLTKAHEVIYHFVKQQKYYYNLDAIREPFVASSKEVARQKRIDNPDNKYTILTGSKAHSGGIGYSDNGKNPGDVWSITTQPYPESHFAVFPLELVRRPILAGCPVGGTVLDPFGGSGTVGEFCRHNDRNAMLFELNPDYVKLIKKRSMANIPELESFS